MAIEIDKLSDTPIDIPGYDGNPVVQIESQTAAARDLYDAALRPIETQEDFAWANDELGEIRKRLNEVEAFRVKLTKPLLETKRNIDILFKRPLQYLADAEVAIKASLGKYLHAREQVRIAAEGARTKALQEAEANRGAALAAAKTPEAVQEAVAKSAVALSQAAAVPIPQAPQAEGLSTSEIWKYDITDFGALVAHVAANPALLLLLSPNETNIRKCAGMTELPGVSFYKVQSIRRRVK